MKYKVGDRVKYRPEDAIVYDILYVHSKDQRVYYVLAYKGDMPSVHTEVQMNTFTVVSTQPLLISIGNDDYKAQVDIVNDKPDWSTLEVVGKL
jgi:hypothetical protein